MTLKMHEVIDFPTSFIAKVKTQPLPFKTSYHLALLSGELEKHINFYQENFREILFTYGKKDENGNLVPTADGEGIMLAEETMQEAYEKLAALRDLDVELPEFKFSIDDFKDVVLTPDEVSHILVFMEA